jgi:hypothetical protein
MIWIICIIIGVVIGLLAGFIFHRLIENKILTGIMTAIVMILTVVATYYISPHYYAWTFPSSIRSENSLIDLIATQSPAEFNAYVSKAKHNILTRGNPDNELSYTIEFVSHAMTKYSQNASNKSLYDYLKADNDLDKKLFETDPVLVLANEFPDMFMSTIDPTKLFENGSEEYFKATLNAAENVIKSSIKNSQPSLTKEDIQKAEAVFRDVISTLSDKYGEKIVLSALQHPNDPSLDKTLVAKILISFNDEILARGENDVGVSLRYAYRAGSK